MSNDDDELDREVRELASQLTDEQMDSIARKLGLRDDERVRRTGESETGNCSFCGKPSSEVGDMVTNGAGARICRQCLGAFSSGPA
ncbi:ClpX C4-type zinc finger protein [Halospina denitrificans]|uniref:ClpX C4-type zinc finger protein n=1 Tax=Halospina denitrificans TaxID=332522 RepID=A0A4R7JYG6_9GAMM|nr:ClpX C4-type zinc finger protein [Halospina denitrificans]TDT42984.1 ClpX C4-type zinc finger protein [Halospina denitrificans]